jgi:phage gpG-like protein
VTFDDLADEFAQAGDRAGDPAPALDAFVNVMQASILANFAAEGRPAAWEPTRFPLPGHVATLHNEGTLIASAKALRDGNDVILTAGGNGQPPAKAPALQYGAQLHNKRRMGTGRFVTRRSWKNTYRYGGSLPPRPYLLFQQDDLDFFGDKLPSYIFMSVKF